MRELVNSIDNWTSTPVSPNRAYEASIEAVGVALEEFVLDAGFLGEKARGGEGGRCGPGRRSYSQTTAVIDLLT